MNLQTHKYTNYLPFPRPPAQDELLTNILEYSNIVFSVAFGIEMAFKLCAYGLVGYIKDGFNVFDGFIVILRYVETFRLFKRF